MTEDGDVLFGATGQQPQSVSEQAVEEPRELERLCRELETGKAVPVLRERRKYALGWLGVSKP